ncbi:MAG: hypothetical protein KatS3mg129_0960 [Leptospiraceae bacterium]|nr:MAG: hypothetical protein KatS3mg129_0960 [Leptospiraceae bacterium]
MNQICGTIHNIKKYDKIYDVYIDYENHILNVILLENPLLKKDLKKYKKVNLYFKEFAPIISKKRIKNIIKIENEFKLQIEKIQKGKVFHLLKLKNHKDYFYVYIKDCLHNFNLKDTIYIYIKPTDFILELL